MSLGSLPLANGPITGKVVVPGSKSMTIRALAAAAMAEGRSHLYGGLHADDTTAMKRSLGGFGVIVTDAGDAWTVEGGRLRTPDTVIDAGESGLTARIMLALATLVDGEVTVDGRGRLWERPMGPLFATIRSQGVHVEADGETLPATVTGRGGLWGGEIAVDTTLSTQFLTALLLVAPTAANPVTVRVEGERGAAGYPGITVEVMEAFGATISATTTGFEVLNTGYAPADYGVPPDASAAAYPLVAAAITGGVVEVVGLQSGGSQPDLGLVDRLVAMGCTAVDGESGIVLTGPDRLDPVESDMSDAPDGAMALAVACLFARGTSRLTGLSTLRHKESDRLAAMAEGLNRLGGHAVVEEDTLVITGSRPRPAVIDSHGDHRVAMSFALAGLRIPGVEVSDPEVVDKTWPGYWETMRNLARQP